jgi:hypothetical protein
VTLRDQGMSLHKVAAATKLPLTTIWRNNHKARELDSCYLTPAGQGQAQVFTPHKICHAVWEITSGQAKDATQVQQQLFPNFSPIQVVVPH